jgi:hypothetical protein
LIHWEGLGECLEALAGSTKCKAVVAAPFIKRAALQRVVGKLSTDAELLCVTRWRVDELACGVSDLDVFADVMDRGNARVLLVNELHAKYFRFDTDVVLGSCNITGAALGFRSLSNLELAVTLQADNQTRAFEDRLLRDSVIATQPMYEAMKRVLAGLAQAAPLHTASESPADQAPDAAAESLATGWAQWLPSCRVPTALFDAYEGRLDELTIATRATALADLRQLAIPRGLSQAAFNAFVAGTMLSSPIIARLAQFATTPRRFGEMRELLREVAPASSATSDWQTVMRWLLHFSPDRFSMRVANFSEIFSASW